MASEQKKVIKINIPSELGYEKVVLTSAALIAKMMGFSEDKVEDVKTAVGEACANAIEHGNSLDHQKMVLVIMVAKDNCLQINVIDEGLKPIPAPALGMIPNRPDFRGMGMFLIRELMDEVKTKSQPGRNEIEMITYLSPCEME